MDLWGRIENKEDLKKERRKFKRQLKSHKREIGNSPCFGAADIKSYNREMEKYDSHHRIIERAFRRYLTLKEKKEKLVGEEDYLGAKEIMSTLEKAKEEINFLEKNLREREELYYFNLNKLILRKDFYSNTFLRN